MKTDKILCTIEARMTSSRLPGKVLMPAAGKPLLQIMVERLKKSKFISEIMVATTTNATDDPIEALCHKIGCGVFRGSELNVLERVASAARAGEADIVVETTGDCPLIDVKLVDEAISKFLREYPTTRFVTNSGPEITLPWGFDVYVFKASDLLAISEGNTDESDREHVSYKFYRPESGDQFKPTFLRYSGKTARPDLRITLDYKEDYQLIKGAYEELSQTSPDFGLEELIEWVDRHPTLRDAAINVRNGQDIMAVFNK